MIQHPSLPASSRYSHDSNFPLARVLDHLLHNAADTILPTNDRDRLGGIADAMGRRLLILRSAIAALFQRGAEGDTVGSPEYYRYLRDLGQKAEELSLSIAQSGGENLLPILQNIQNTLKACLVQIENFHEKPARVFWKKYRKFAEDTDSHHGNLGHNYQKKDNC